MSTMTVGVRSASLFYLLLAALGGALLSFLFLRHGQGPRLSPVPPSIQAGAPSRAPKPDCDLKITRLKGYGLVAPLISAEPECPSPRLTPLMEKVSTLVDSFRTTGVVSSVSVYVRSMKDASWASYNGQVVYDPGSMMKVPVLITFLRMEELDPGSLQRQVKFDHAASGEVKPQFPPGQLMTLGASYTYEELLQRMIEHSDNEATTLLMRHMNTTLFQRVFTDLGMPYPELSSKTYKLSAPEYSIFMKALYNGSLLSLEHSERALRLLTKCGFKQGMVNGLPPGTELAHKFGESGDEDLGVYQLHESGIVFEPKGDYVLTIMTQGPEMMRLPTVLSTIAACVDANMPR